MLPRLVSGLRPRSSSPVYGNADMLDYADRQGRRRPFSTWVKKLTNFKGGSSSEGHHDASKRNMGQTRMTSKKRSKNNNPYPQSGRVGTGPNHYSHQTFSTGQTGATLSAASLGHGSSIRSSGDGRAPPTAGTRSVAPTVSTDREPPHSVMAPSHGASSVGGTSRTVNGGVDSRRGGDSTFSSPAPSVRSLTTTLTTVQSMAPNGTVNVHTTTASSTHQAPPGSSQVIHFNQPFPNTPASAIPSHLAPSSIAPGHPTTYSSATANNLLTDNASILTLASSSKQRRRRSLDTDASVRALAPSSLFGGSRESLPLSVLSANIDAAGGSGLPTTPGLQHAGSRIGAERTSIYSATGILASERNSFYAKQSLAGGGDGASVRSGLLGHGRADSISGSIGGLTSPLASPREMAVSEKEKELSMGKDINEADEIAEHEDTEHAA